MSECGKMLYKMKSDKSPGGDGFTAEFLKVFWGRLGFLVVRSLNESYLDGELSLTQRRGIITCLPKPDKDRNFLKNWRPITLLNTIYKIGSKVIAERMKLVLEKIISEYQIGFMKNRFISENTRVIYDVLEMSQRENITGLLLLLDFEKAFDTIDWEFLVKTLENYNFGESLIQWVKLFTTNIKSSIIMNGHMSQEFDIERGCRQGDPISPYLFILVLNLLTLQIVNNENISGLKIKNNEFLINHFADGSINTLRELFEILKHFEECSGLAINQSKSRLT